MVNWSSRRVGGAESYVEAVIAELARLGHDIALWHEVDRPVARPLMALPPGVPTWDAAALGLSTAVAALREWEPDVTLTHGVLDASTHAPVMAVGPSVYFAHTYYGTCISGQKTWKTLPMPCSRPLGRGCLAHYYPHRCGGLSPVTMVRDYVHQRTVLEVLRGYDQIVVASDHMRTEYIAHGFDAARVRTAPYFIRPAEGEALRDDPSQDPSSKALHASAFAQRTFELLFIGRMDVLKGGALLLDALVIASAALKAHLRLTFIGDGPERGRWQERSAAVVAASAGDVGIEFTGWLERPEIDRRLRASQLLVLPSVWPEPFGLVGLEAGLQGIPAAAFSVGGIPQWLHDGVNGSLAAERRPSAAGLANAIARALASPEHHQRLRTGARATALTFTPARHTALLLDTLAAASRSRRPGGSTPLDSAAARGY